MGKDTRVDTSKGSSVLNILPHLYILYTCNCMYSAVRVTLLEQNTVTTIHGNKILKLQVIQVYMYSSAVHVTLNTSVLKLLRCQTWPRSSRLVASHWYSKKPLTSRNGWRENSVSDIPSIPFDIDPAPVD